MSKKMMIFKRLKMRRLNLFFEDQYLDLIDFLAQDENQGIEKCSSSTRRWSIEKE